MSIGVGDVDLSGGDLAFLMSAQEDRMLANATSGALPQASPALEVNRQLDPSEGVNYAGGSSYSEGMPLLPSSVGLTGVMGAGVNHDEREARESLCGSLAGAAGLFETIGRTDTYLMLMRGTPWPTPLNEGKISAGYVTPTVMSRVSNINKGWNAAAQPGGAPGTQVGYSEKTLGPTSWAEAMNYSPSPLADKIGSLQGLGAISVKASDPGMRKVLKAASNPGTHSTGEVARELLKQSVKVAALTAKRAAVMDSARKNYTSLVRRVANLDSQTQLIADRLFDADGEPHPSVSVADIRAYRKLRQKAFKLGREAIRYQKTNVLATGLTKNGYTQAKLLQDMAMTMMTGKQQTTAVLAAQFEAVGKESGALRALRENQVVRWKSKDKVSGLAGFSSPVQEAVNADYWEADLAGMELVEMAYLGELEGLWGSIKKAARSVTRKVKKTVRKVKKTVRKAGSAVKRTVRKAKRTVKRTVRRAGRVVTRTARRAGKAVMSARRAATRAARSAARAAKRAATSAARATARAAKRAAKAIATPVIKTARAMAKPAWRAVKAGARVAVAPIKATYNVGRHVARGDFRKAVSSVAKSVKDTASGIAEAYGAITFGIGCAFDKSPIGRAAYQAVGQAAGTFYGGPVGGAAGNEAGRKANQAARGICDGMDRIGLTRGKIKPGQIVPAFKQTAKRLAKETFSPKELLKSGMNIGMNYATAGAAPPGANVAQIAASQAKDRIKQFGRDQLARSPAFQKVAKYTPAIQAAYAATGAFTGGGVNMDVLKDTLQTQGTRALKRHGPQIGGRLAGKIVGGRAGRAIATGGRIASMSSAERKAYLRRQAIARGRRLATRGVTAVAGRRAGRLVSRAASVAGMTPRERETFLRRQAMTGGRRLATRAARRVSPQAAAAARRAQALSRMSPTQRQALLRRQAMRGGRRVATRAVRRARPQMRRPSRQAQIIMRNRAMARARAVARQRMGVPGALLRA